MPASTSSTASFRCAPPTVRRPSRLTGGRPVAEVWRAFREALRDLGVAADLWDKPQEMPDETTPFAENEHDRTVDLAQARRLYRVLATVHGLFDEFRSPFFGRSGVQLWWGAFDLAVLLFSGAQVTAPEDRGYIMRYDLDAEHLNAGFWPGSDAAPQAIFYAHIHPRPAGCETAAVEPPARAGSRRWASGCCPATRPAAAATRRPRCSASCAAPTGSRSRWAAGTRRPTATYRRPSRGAGRRRPAARAGTRRPSRGAGWRRQAVGVGVSAPWKEHSTRF